MTRPDSIEWPADDKTLRTVPDRTPLTRRGRYQAALKSADYRGLGPRVRSERFVVHVVVARRGDIGPACNPAMLLDDLFVDADAVRARCRHPACSALYALADAAAPPTPRPTTGVSKRV